ncbi:transport protein [Ateline gammaherpesvirus 3]|uniref:Transport protein n=1 Tax=Ateline herpesvirus 3 TaxID=85618 RepID=Q9YTQ6_ATHV3|nr:transport protein [Ateline gammaherpesvirus 3]AAC95539.1 transport protein [Ateline gammaherpesvirus 3]
MAQHLAAVYSQIYGFTLDVSVLTFVDPSHINRKIFTNNMQKINKIYLQIMPLLQDQNNVESTSLSVELQHLLTNLKTMLDIILKHLTNYETYFDNIHSLSTPCSKHKLIVFQFYNNCSVSVRMCIINDIEIFLKRLSSVFYCIRAHDATYGLNKVIDFLGHLRGISPIPLPDTYLSNIPCIYCLWEHMMLPNQGESLQSMMTSVNCTHVCNQLNPEPVQGMFENELLQRHIIVDTQKPKEPTQQCSINDKIRDETLSKLSHHTIFENTSAPVLELSNLIYWSSGTHTKCTNIENTSEIVKLLSHETKMQNYRKYICKKSTHFFDKYKPYSIETIFCGGIFNSVDETVKSLKSDCSLAFMKRANYQQLIKKQNELFVRLNNILKGEDTSETSTPPVPISEKAAAVNPEQVINDAHARKDAYLQKVTKDGLKSLYACLDTQGAVLSNTLSMRVWGCAVYDEIVKLKNHFLFRDQFISLDWIHLEEESVSGFENSKYIKNLIYSQKLSSEHISSLTLQFYQLITGPLSQNVSYFPLPPNIALAHCLDAAGALPHHKLLITEMIWPTIEPKDWVSQTYNKFYTITSGDLNNIQKEVWFFIRELVLSVSLYNRALEKNLQIFSVLNFEKNCVKLSPNQFKSGIYLTYEDRSPLIFIYRNQGWVFKDLYTLMYHHLQLSVKNHDSE